MNWLYRAYDNRALRRSRLVKLPADTYAGRILAAKLQTLDDVAQAFGITEDDMARGDGEEFATLREGYIARCRAETIAAVTPPVTPKMTRKLALEKRREAKRAEREAVAEIAAQRSIIMHPDDAKRLAHTCAEQVS